MKPHFSFISKQKLVRATRFCCCLTVIFASVVLLSADNSYSCSAIARLSEHGRPLVAANYDWQARDGIVYLSPRGQIKSASVLDKTTQQSGISWTSRFASLTVSQFGRDYPMQGINERGLMGAVLVAPASYPSGGELGVITENLWLQYQLDSYESVHDVMLNIGDLGISKISADLHWFLCDATGECGIVEFTSGGAKMFRSREPSSQIVTNSSVLDSWQHYQSWQASNLPIPKGYSSLSRFVRLVLSQIEPIGKSLVDTLNDVALEGFTTWQSVFDLKSRSFEIRLWNGQFNKISFEGLSLGCSPRLPVMQLSEGVWHDYDAVMTKSLLHEATRGLPVEEIRAIEASVKISEDIHCRRH